MVYGWKLSIFQWQIVSFDRQNNGRNYPKISWKKQPPHKCQEISPPQSGFFWCVNILLEFFDFTSRFITSGSITSLISLRSDLSLLLLILLLSYQCPGCSCYLSHRGTVILVPHCIEPSLSSFCPPAAVLNSFSLINLPVLVCFPAFDLLVLLLIWIDLLSLTSYSPLDQVKTICNF